MKNGQVDRGQCKRCPGDQLVIGRRTARGDSGEGKPRLVLCPIYDMIGDKLKGNS